MRAGGHARVQKDNVLMGVLRGYVLVSVKAIVVHAPIVVLLSCGCSLRVKLTIKAPQLTFKRE